MYSLSEELGRLDRLLLCLSKESSSNIQTQHLLHTARRRVQSLEKKTRAFETYLWLSDKSVTGSGGAAPLCMSTMPPQSNRALKPHMPPTGLRTCATKTLFEYTYVQ